MAIVEQPEFSQIKAFVLDVDGVLTDGTLYCFESGEQVRAFNIKDGYAIRNAINKGYLVGVITAKNERSVRLRLSQLGITDLYMGSDNKLLAFNDFLSTKALGPESVLYMGDDVPDLEVMLKAGIAACPADAAQDIIEIAHYRCEKNGGRGAVREVIEKVMRAQKTW